MVSALVARLETPVGVIPDSAHHDWLFYFLDRVSLNLGLPFLFRDRGNSRHDHRGEIADGTINANIGLYSDRRLAQVRMASMTVAGCLQGSVATQMDCAPNCPATSAWVYVTGWENGWGTVQRKTELSIKSNS